MLVTRTGPTPPCLLTRRFSRSGNRHSSSRWRFERSAAVVVVAGTARRRLALAARRNADPVVAHARLRDFFRSLPFRTNLDRSRARLVEIADVRAGAPVPVARAARADVGLAGSEPRMNREDDDRHRARCVRAALHLATRRPEHHPARAAAPRSSKAQHGGEGFTLAVRREGDTFVNDRAATRRC